MSQGIFPGILISEMGVSGSKDPRVLQLKMNSLYYIYKSIYSIKVCTNQQKPRVWVKPINGKGPGPDWPPEPVDSDGTVVIGHPLGVGGKPLEL